YSHLKQREQRADGETIIQQLRRATSKVYGMSAFFRNPAAIQVGAYSSDSNYQYVLQGSNIDDLAAVSTALMKQLKKVPALQDVNSDLEMNNPQIDVQIL